MTAMGHCSMKKNEYEKEAVRKKAVVAGLCLVIIAILIFLLSRAKYTTPEMKGYGQYEPALFNTVLLGKLTDDDEASINDAISYSDDYTNPEAFHVTGKTISKSLTLSQSNEFGEINENDTSRINLRPGAEVVIPFTVTNGTTITGNGKVSNVAQSDIKYTIKVIGGNNLPVKFTLKDVDGDSTDKKNVYALVKPKNSNAYAINDKDDKVFVNGSRILKWKGDENISVHRYELIVTWPSSGTFDYTDSQNETKTVAYADRRFMKELENIELQIEVESYVNYDFTGDNQISYTGAILLKDSVENADYVPNNESSIGTIHGQKAVSYSMMKTAEGARAQTYDFVISNGEINKSLGSFTDLKVALAIPVKVSDSNGAVKDTVLGSDKKGSYTITYEGQNYSGSISNDGIITSVWDKEKSGYVSQAAYRIIYFNSLKITDFKSTEHREDKLRLTFIPDSGNTAEDDEDLPIDDFRIYVYNNKQ